jgi:dCTP deaminase
MSVRPDKWIRNMALEHKIIDPFVDHQVKDGNISYGLSSYGYDFRVADEFKILKNASGVTIDPKGAPPEAFEDFKGDVLTLPPHTLALGRSVEYFQIPRSVVTIAFGKSTYARCGVLVNITPFEPEWEGYVTLAITNTSASPVKIYANEGIAQVLFLESDDECAVSYQDRQGKYQAQKEITMAKA